MYYRAIGFGLVSLGITASTYYALKKKGKSSREEFLKSYENLRDTSRPGYKSYGLNFGFKTDQAVKNI